MKYTIVAYTPVYFNEWNRFISKSKNGTFLFHRNFMEYHSDRFEDYSLLIFDGNKLTAVLPANKVGTEVYSHQGLTYGGLLYSVKLKQSAVIEIFKEVLMFLELNSITKLHVKQIPYIYHKQPSQELEYALFVVGAKITRTDALSVIELSSKIKIAANRMEGVKKGMARGLSVKETNDFTKFWHTVLAPNLLVKHNAKPVHSLEEIIQLKKDFPNNIKLLVVEHEGKIAAGTVLFETDTVIHAQYISAGDDKNELGSLDFLFYHLINEVFVHKKFFDFGISNEQQGKKFNEGLAFWKQSYGARTVVQHFYEVETANYNLLDYVFI